VSWAITVTWMDGQQENYPAASYTVIDGELVLTETDSFGRRDDTQHFPLAGIRTWKAERR
jgi:hypothetical protein